MTKNIKTILVVVAFALVFVIAGGLIIRFARADKGGNANNPTTDIEKPDDDLVVTDKGNTVVDGNGNELKAGKVYSMPRNIMFYSVTNSPTSVTVKAIIKPSNADDKRVVWASSNDTVVTIEPSATDTLTATITLNGNLVDGTETITCRSVDNPAAYAECVIDQLVGGSNVELRAGIEGEPTELVFGKTYTVWCSWDNNSPGTGTIMGDTADVEWSIDLDYSFMQKIDEVLARKGITGNSDTICGNDYSFDSDGKTGTLYSSPYECFYGGDCDAETFNNAFKLAMKECDTHATFRISGSYVYGGKTYRTGYVDIPVSFSLEGIWIGVSGVDLDNDNVIFS